MITIKERIKKALSLDCSTRERHLLPFLDLQVKEGKHLTSNEIWRIIVNIIIYAEENNIIESDNLKKLVEDLENRAEKTPITIDLLNRLLYYILIKERNI